MARLRWLVAPAPSVDHFRTVRDRSGRIVRQAYRVPTFRAVPVDPSADKYVMIDGKLRRRLPPPPLAKAA
jgi:hypothetical protein